MKKVILLILLTPIALFSQIQRNSEDTLYYRYTDIFCPQINSSFYAFHNINISSVYVIEDSLKVDLNFDGCDDYVLKVTPEYMLPIADFDCFIDDSLVFRPLVILFYNKISSKYEIKEVLFNQLSDAGGVLSTYHEMSRNDKGFSIAHQGGNRMAWDYVVSYTWRADSLRIDEISKNCRFYYDNCFKDTTITGKNLNLPAAEINIADSLSTFCGCEKYTLISQNDYFVKKISQQLLSDDEAFASFQQLILLTYVDNNYHFPKQKFDRITFDYYMRMFNAGDALCRFIEDDTLSKYANSCLQELMQEIKIQNHTDGLLLDNEFILLSKFIGSKDALYIKKKYFEKICSSLKEFEDDEAMLMYLNLGMIDVQYFIDGWPGYESASDFVERFDKVKTKLLHDKKNTKQFTNMVMILSDSNKNTSEIRNVFNNMYVKGQKSNCELYHFFDFETLCYICNQCYNEIQQSANKNIDSIIKKWYEELVSK